MINIILHCALSLAAQCIVIGPVCGRVCNGRAGGVRSPNLTTTSARSVCVSLSAFSCYIMLWWWRGWRVGLRIYYKRYVYSAYCFVDQPNVSSSVQWPPSDGWSQRSSVQLQQLSVSSELHGMGCARVSLPPSGTPSGLPLSPPSKTKKLPPGQISHGV